MVERILNLMEAEGASQTELAKVTGVSNKTISAWKRGLQKPSSDAIVKLADYFSVSADYLLGRTDTKDPNKVLSKKKEPSLRLVNKEERENMERPIRAKRDIIVLAMQEFFMLKSSDETLKGRNNAYKYVYTDSSSGNFNLRGEDDLDITALLTSVEMSKIELMFEVFIFSTERQFPDEAIPTYSEFKGMIFAAEISKTEHPNIFKLLDLLEQEAEVLKARKVDMDLGLIKAKTGTSN